MAKFEIINGVGIIPEGTTEIEEFAFIHCENLESIFIPNSVTKIGWLAFGGCENLKSITIPNSVTEIGEDAFRGCTSLNTIYVTEGDSENIKEILPEKLHKLVEEME